MDDRLVRHALGFWQVREPPTAEQLHDYYRNRYYQGEHGNYRKKYSAEEVAWFDCQTARVVAAAVAAGATDRGRALDVGCGEGFSLAWLTDHGWDAYGIDYSFVGLHSFHPHLADRFRIADIGHPLEPVVQGERYDLVFVRNVLEHVLDPIRLLENLKQLVTPSGICAVTVPNDASEWQEHLLAKGAVPRRFWIAIPDHISYFTADGLRNVATSTGWHCRRILAEFPIDWFLATPSLNYVTDPTKGQEAHSARISVDRTLSHRPMNDVLAFLEAMAGVGMGRQITAVLSPTQ